MTFAADYKLGWDATKFWTFLAVLAYFSLNGALTFWIWGVEKGKVFMGQIDHPSAGYQVVRALYLAIYTASSLTEKQALDSLTRHKAHSDIQSHSTIYFPKRPKKRSGIIITVYLLVRCRRVIHCEAVPAMAGVRSTFDWTGGSLE